MLTDFLCVLTRDTEQSSSESKVYSFEMSSLTEHLKHQGEQNKTASYFNIDILKYQVGLALCNYERMMQVNMLKLVKRIGHIVHGSECCHDLRAS